MATGRKTYNNAINWTNEDRPMRGLTIAEIAKAQGKSVGRYHHRPLEPRHAGRPGRRPQRQPQEPRRNRQRDARRRVARRDHGRRQSRLRQRRPPLPATQETRLPVGRRRRHLAGAEGGHAAVEADREQGRFRGLGRRPHAAESAGQCPGRRHAPRDSAAVRLCSWQIRHRPRPRAAVRRPTQSQRPLAGHDDQGGDQLPRRQSRRAST